MPLSEVHLGYLYDDVGRHQGTRVTTVHGKKRKRSTFKRHAPAPFYSRKTAKETQQMNRMWKRINRSLAFLRKPQKEGEDELH
ncbi:MAG: hypothetical protein ACRD6W_15240 [Nitrososphaerales archaeon]